MHSQLKDARYAASGEEYMRSHVTVTGLKDESSEIGRETTTPIQTFTGNSFLTNKIEKISININIYHFNRGFKSVPIRVRIDSKPGSIWVKRDGTLPIIQFIGSLDRSPHYRRVAFQQAVPL